MQFKTDQMRRPLLAGIAGTGVVGLLAATAIVGVTAPAFATDVPCGVPARDAVYTTIYHAALPAVNGTEIVTPAKDAWTETIEVPAVTKTVYDIARYQRTGWVSLADKPAGWTQVADRIAVDEASHLEYDLERYEETDWLRLAPAGAGWTVIDEQIAQAHQPALGDEYIEIDNPAYVPAEPAVGEPTITVPNPDYRPAVPAVPEISHTEYEWWKPFHGTRWEATYPGVGWWWTGDSRTVVTQSYVPAKPAQGDPTKVMANPAYVPAQPAQGAPRITVKNPAFVPEVPEIKEFKYAKRETRTGEIVVPGGWTVTAEHKVIDVAEVKEYQYALYETQAGVDVVPAGWTVKRERVIEIEPARTETVDHPAVPAVTRAVVVTPAKPAYTSTVLVTPATPAGPPCEDDTPPAQPGERIEVAMSDEIDCEEGVVTSTKTTTTTEYVWDATDKAWELGEPVVTVETDERAATTAECPAPAPAPVEEDEVAGVEKERPKPTTKPVNAVDTGDEVLGVEKSVAVPTAVNAGLGEAIVQGAERNVAGEAMLGGSGLMLLLAGWMRFGRRERRANEA